MNPNPSEVLERFWSKVEKTDTCWLWTGSLASGGYGSFNYKYKHYRAHRLSYEQIRGEIPKGLVLDHLCRVRSCVNPDHLEAVTHRVNILRGIGGSAVNAKKTHCKNGHLLSGDNLRNRLTVPWRECRQCHGSWRKLSKMENKS